MTPHKVHHGHAVELTQRRVVTLTAAFAANPNRFKQVAPKPPVLPNAAWINPPQQNLASTKTHRDRSRNFPTQVSQMYSHVPELAAWSGEHHAVHRSLLG